VRAHWLLLLLLLAATAARGQGRKCTCAEGNASYLYLRCPKAVPADPDPCPAVHDGIHPARALPASWNDLCWQVPRMACFLRRHAASWKITCSLCVAKPCCPFPNWHNCPECHGEEKPPDLPELEKLQGALTRMRKLGGKRVEMAMSPHFLVISDIDSLKIATAGGGPRIMGRHELLHLYLQRAEQARSDFAKVFGPPRERRSLMGLFRSVSTQQAFSASQFGNPKTKLLYGAGSYKLVEGLASNGFILSGRNDDELHFTARHMVGHLCISTYHSTGVHEKHLPQWIFRGAAHWLSKLHPRAKDFVCFCSYEDVTVAGSGARWMQKARRIAARGAQRDPVERMFQASTAKQADYDMHVRAWSWFDLFSREEREPFVTFVRHLRNAKEARVACKAAFGQAPEYVDQRWRERVLGRRNHLAATKKEKDKEVDADEATARELTRLTTEVDLQLLASQIRGLERCQNVPTGRVLLALIDSRASDRVQEVIALVLSRTEDPKVRAYFRGQGFDRAGKLGRAVLCRVFGETGDEEAVPVLQEALSDSFWLVRANAARALARLGDGESIDAIGRMAAKAPAGKVRIAAMDALGIYGGAAKRTIPVFERNLMSRSWQIKVATCDAFRAIGDPAAVDALIGRLDSEGGRVHDEIRRSLKALTGLDRDWKAEIWRKWWATQKRVAGLEKKMREQLEREQEEKEKRKVGRRGYATDKKPPTYYGLRVFARAVGYVLDISKSMEQGFQVSAAWEKRLGHTFRATTRIGVCKEELAHSIGNLDPRTRLNLVFFNDRVRKWQNVPVAAGAMGENAISAVKNVQPDGQTNYYDALREILGMAGEGRGWTSEFADTPDTLFFLTDGRPTDGEITKADELLAWFNERNRFARLRVHVIAMGRTGVDLEFLRKLAESNGGTFLHLTGRH
jgi:hypothetical protein